MSCVVPNCRSYSRLLKKSGENTSLHRFPGNHLREKWIAAVGRDNWTAKQHDRICSKHFESDCFVLTHTKRLLLPNAIPTIFQRPLKGSHLNKQLEGTDNENMLSSNEMLAVFKTSPQHLQESDYDTNTDYDKEIMAYTMGADLESEDEDKKNILSGNDNLPGAMPTTFLLPIQMTCQKCLSITKQYEEKVLKQDEEIKSLLSELEEMKSLLERSDKDLERAKEVSKKRLQTIWKLRKRNERN